MLIELIKISITNVVPAQMVVKYASTSRPAANGLQGYVNNQKNVWTGFALSSSMNLFSRIIAPVTRIRTASPTRDVVDIAVSTEEKCSTTSYPKITRETKINKKKITIDIHQDPLLHLFLSVT